MSELINGRTPEDFKDALMRCGRRHCKAESGDCPYYIDCLVGATRLKLMKDAFDYIRYLESERDAALAKAPRWISVKERLPRCGERVLVTNGGSVWEAYLSISHKWVRQEFVWGIDVTHWMPLPSAPKEGESC